ncbi:MAG TPA: hypothetical protein VIV11_32195 [Kofleriaceae bacterium]
MQEKRMQQQPLRVVMSRDGSDANHDVLRDVHGVILRNPHVGELLQIYFDNGRYLVTSKVKRVDQVGDEMIVETANSTYRLHPDTN